MIGRDPRFPPGWWILPGLALSSLCWAVIFAWLLY